MEAGKPRGGTVSIPVRNCMNWLKVKPLIPILRIKKLKNLTGTTKKLPQGNKILREFNFAGERFEEFLRIFRNLTYNEC